jgi:uncharacterized membrane protein YhaH (DUF805 family)
MPIKDLLFSFNGRIRRSQWWAARLSLIGVALVLLFAGVLGVGLLHMGGVGATNSGPAVAIGILILLPVVAWIDAALGVKRLHDQNLTGWLFALILVPYLGGLFSFIWLGCLDGTPKRNQFGPSPKFPDREAEVFA